MSKIWSYAFWRRRSRETAALPYRGMMLPTAVLVAFTILMGSWAQPFLGLATRAAETLTKPDEYIRVVLTAKQARQAAAAPPSDRMVARVEDRR